MKALKLLKEKLRLQNQYKGVSGMKPFIKATEEAIEELEELGSIKKENTRLKKQLANNHHIECMCSFCKPVGKSNE